MMRQPDRTPTPYVGVGVGGFYFKGSDKFNGRQIVPGLNLQAGVKILMTEEWGFFVEGKYNRATLTNFIRALASVPNTAPSTPSPDWRFTSDSNVLSHSMVRAFSRFVDRLSSPARDISIVIGYHPIVRCRLE